ncbi:MAG: immunoglobulin domain-containing protein, partial [Limisphaerales bacterium]
MKHIQPLLAILLALAFASAANAQLSATATITDFGPSAPTPGTNDVAVYFQVNDGFNYYDNNSPQPGQIFTTGNDPGGVYTLTGLSLKTDGAGGGGETNSQTYTLRIFSVSGNTASLLQTYTATLALVESNWVTWSGLSVPLTTNTQYAYTIAGATGYERLATATNSPYSGGQICLIPAAGGTINLGSAYDAAFNVNLAVGSIGGGTVTLTQSSSAPTPGANDISQLTSTPLYITPAQNDDGLNYYFDNATPPGATFTTGTNATGYVLNTMSIKTAGGQGGLSGGGQAYVLRIYKAESSPAILLATYTSDSSTFTFVNSDWLQWTNLGGLGLLPNTKYAYTLHRVTAGWEHMANYGGNPYAGGEICLINPTTSAITYGTTHNSDAAFVAGLQTSPGPIANQPTYTPNMTPVYAGSQLTLNETALGEGTLYYEWLTDGGTGGGLTPVGGFTTDNNLAVDTTSFTPGTTYNYAVIVTNAFNTVTSSVVSLLITNASPPVIITNTASPNTTTNFVGLSETFKVTAQGTAPITYQWQVATDASGDGAVSISGATNATLELDNLQLTDTGYYSVVASNSVSPFIAQT